MRAVTICKVLWCDLCNLIFTMTQWGRWNCSFHFPKKGKCELMVSIPGLTYLFEMTISVSPLAEVQRVSLGLFCDHFFPGESRSPQWKTQCLSYGSQMRDNIHPRFHHRGVKGRDGKNMVFTVRGTDFDFLALPLPQLCNSGQVAEPLWACIFSLVKWG